uniref:Putative secreted protein n=1 Tax=Anopheles marajoara TaxID=58244 RepID=A0A2M4CD52_9DIPT
MRRCSIRVNRPVLLRVLVLLPLPPLPVALLREPLLPLQAPQRPNPPIRMLERTISIRRRSSRRSTRLSATLWAG